MYLAQSSNWGHFPDRIGIWKCWSLRRGEEEAGEPVREKPLRAKMRTNNTQASLDANPGIDPGTHW